ncbi:MAG: hypothetical protein Q7T33_12725 [Dehalococcoidia bacterium]|nr:hypothetical protein [Dehalococcoidia bacterium]
MVDAIKRGPSGEGWRALDLSPRLRALCAVAEKLSATPTRMVEEDWQPVRELGFDDKACLEVAHIVGIFNYLTRLADGFGLQLDDGTRRASETGEPLRRPGT